LQTSPTCWGSPKAKPQKADQRRAHAGLQALVIPYFERRLLPGATLGIVDADLSPGRVAVSIEAAGLVDDSTGEGTYYTDGTGASAAQATYVEV
jgi:hypothetical protein